MKFLNKLFLTTLAVLTIVLPSCGNTTILPDEEDVSSNGSNSDNSSSEFPQEIQEFEGIEFKSKTFTYDGNEHFIYAEGVPEFATVEYLNNGKIEIGTYQVVAKISAEGYREASYNAKLIIKGKEFEGITFSDQTYTYNGEPHYLEVEGLPGFATVTYSNNGKSEIGTYEVSATIKAEHYETLKLTAKLTIKGKTFEGITFKDKEFAEDGYYHYIYVEGAPDFATVKYSDNNGQKYKGTYVITATISAHGYEKLVLTAKLIISNKLPDAILADRTLLYTGNDQHIVYSLPDNLPTSTEENFKIDGKTVSKENFCVKTVGVHTVSITLTNTRWGYDPSTVTAKITVIENNVGGVDQDKTPLTINENLKYQTLRSKILEGNYTLKEEYFDDYFYPDGSTKSELSQTTITYVNNNEVFEYFFYPEYDEFMENQTHYRHTKLSNGEVRSAYFEDGVLDGGYWESSYKTDSSYFQENVIGRTGLEAMAILNESSDGGFEDSEEGGYKTAFGTFEIDSANNQFIHDVRTHYYHEEWDHDEHSRFTIYNIGNTTINVPDVFDAFKVDAEFDEIDGAYINGFNYVFHNDYASMDPVLNSISTTYLPKGEYILPAVINDLPVLQFSTGYYSKYFNKDCSGYTFKVYFDRYGEYQGEYEDLGHISGYSALYELMYDGADVLFYGEW